MSNKKIIKTKSKKSVDFFSFKLNKSKYKILMDKAKLILDFRIKLSNIFHKDIDKYRHITKFDAHKILKTEIVGLSCNDVQHAIDDVIIAYANKFDKCDRKLSFYTITDMVISFYKKKTQYKKKGDIKTINFTKNYTDISKSLTYLAKNYPTKEQVLTFNDYKTEEEEIFFDNLKKHVILHGYDRLMKLAMLKRSNVYRIINKEAIKFESLTYRSSNTIFSPIVSFNKKYNSEVKAFVTLGGFGKNNREKIKIPVSYSKDYHGSMKDYKDKCRNKEYTLYFVDNKTVKVILCKDSEKTVITGCDQTIGVDVNLKHNMYSLSDGFVITYNQDVIDGYIKHCNHQEKVQKQKKEEQKKRLKKDPTLKEEPITLSEKQIEDNRKWKGRLVGMLIKNTVDLCKHAISKGKDHIVMEELDQLPKTKGRMENGEKYSKFSSFIGISGFVTRVQSLCAKYGLQITQIQPHYTSQMCPKCGCIDKENRPTQEEFKCVKCGREDNADHNASINIQNRVDVKVLRDMLLKQKMNGEYETIKYLGKDKIRQFLHLPFV